MYYSQIAVRNYIDNNDIKKGSFAEKIGVKLPKLSLFLKGERHLPFVNMLAIQKIFFKDDETFIKKACLEFSYMKQVRPALEYLSSNYYLEEMDQVLTKIRKLAGFEEVYDVYSFIYSYQRKESTYEELLKRAEELLKVVKSDDLITLLTIIKANIHGYLREYIALFRIALQCESDVEKLDNDFMKKSLKIRVYEILCRAYLINRADVEKARHYANRILSKKICAKSEAYATYIIGTSYMFQNFTESFYSLSESARMYGELGLSEHKEIIESQNIKLVETYWGVNLNNIEDSMDSSEKAYRFAKSGDGKSAINILDGLDDSAFRTYYRALATNDDTLHFKALGMFMKEGDYFYAKLPIVELEKKEQYKGIINNLL